MMRKLRRHPSKKPSGDPASAVLNRLVMTNETEIKAGQERTKRIQRIAMGALVGVGRLALRDGRIGSDQLTAQLERARSDTSFACGQ